MKKIIFGLVAAMCGFGLQAAHAQDDYCCPQASCCDMDGFSGLYIGGNLGVLTHVPYRRDLEATVVPSLSGWTVIDTDLTLGIQLGYDWQCCNSLFGLVVDWNWANNDRRTRFGEFLFDNLDINDISFKNTFDWFTTIRARAGLTICDALVYITGGAAVSKISTHWRGVAQAPSDDDYLFVSKFCDSRWGWTGGFGAEFAVWCNWTLGGEFLFMHFSDQRRKRVIHVPFTTPEDINVIVGHSDSAWIGRVILNYRFGDLCSCFCGW